MSGSDLRALSNLLSRSEEATGVGRGVSASSSAIRTPGDFGAPKKIKAITGGAGGANKRDKASRKDTKDIWDDDEVDNHDVDFDDDGRIKPEYEINVGQNVFSQDREYRSDQNCESKGRCSSLR